jgi:serine/threonine protein phosphatase 1
MKRLIACMRRKTLQAASDFEIQKLLPDETFYAIGDIHGCTSLITKILEKIDPPRQSNCPIIFLGDYVDRGDDAAGTLEQLSNLSLDCTERYIFLRGNHEQMLLDFLDLPQETGPLWMKSGGRHTLASYDLTYPYSGMLPEDLTQLRDKFRVKLGPKIECWLRDMPVSWQSGNVFLSHAGTNTTLALEAQTKETLLWGDSSLSVRARRDGVWTVQGHVIVESPLVSAGRVYIDTGAYATGKLTAARFESGKIHFFST